MAGSWKHFTDSQGRFIGDQLLEQAGGDVVEALEEAYGMVWYLADAHGEQSGMGAFAKAQLVEEARQHYKDGLKVSPGFTLRAAVQNINYDKAWGENVRAWPDTEEED